MSIVFLNVNGLTSAINYANYTPGFLNDVSSFYTFIDDSVSGVKDLLTNITAHKYSDIMGTNPYITATYDGTNVMVNLVNGTPPATLDFSLFGTTYNVPVTSGKATIPVTIHPSVSTEKINVTFNINGYPYTSIELGGYGSNAPAQAYKDESGVVHVVPQNSIDLANYWTAKNVDTSWSAVDLNTIAGLTAHTLFHYVIPALNLSLTADEQSGLTDIQNNLLPSLVSTLANALKTDGSSDIHYQSYKLHASQAKTAMDSYTNDRNEIMKYVTLK